MDVDGEQFRRTGLQHESGALVRGAPAFPQSVGDTIDGERMEACGK